MKQVLLTIGASVVLSVFVSALILSNPAPQEGIGGQVHNVVEDFSEGISVDGTTVVSGAGLVTSNGAFTGTGSSSFASIVSTGDVWFGAVASGSGGDVTILDGTATASLIFDSGAAVGSCIEMRSTVGAKVYARVVGTTWTVTSVSCK